MKYRDQSGVLRLVKHQDLATTIDTLTPLIGKNWTSQKLPEDWNRGLLITVPKTGDLSDCSHWRGINLLLAPSEVFCAIILHRSSAAVEPNLRIEQAGFRPNRSCTDQINTLRITLERASEWLGEIYLTFVDFGWLRWSSIWSRLSNIGVPPKIINLVKASLVSDDIQVPRHYFLRLLPTGLCIAHIRTSTAEVWTAPHYG
ncbi:unnamed protein product [Pieris macdunnoughi]|uniref:Reverse transcriptase domain-containing protein n=1 Tax=Pieris macdunnoughi TaxID=345717 RepID=A0A821NS52_9NEOP|nr:unnamed protein product [Pieris macdunnoughi]